MPEPRRRQREAADALAAVAPLATRWIERLLAGNDPPLSVAQYLALRAIAHEDVSSSELARRTGVSGPAVSQLLAALEAQGFLERAQVPDDRRRHALALSPEGTTAYRAAEELVREQIAFLFADLPGPEADALTRLLPRVEAILSGVPPPRWPPRRPPPHRPPPAGRA
jgi:DNA-binding MarR family transcriptional regulator